MNSAELPHGFRLRPSAAGCIMRAQKSYQNRKGGLIMKSFKRIGTKATAALLVMLLTLFALSGCGEPQSDGSNAASSSGGDSAPSVSAEEPSADQPEDQIYEVALTFVNDKYIAEGDESLVKLITDVSGSVKVPADEKGIDEACLQTIELLKKVPEGQADLTTVIGNDMKINSVKVDSEGRATVDLAEVPADGMDNYTEQFFIYQITSTLMNSFSEVSGVTFTVAGQQAETIGGHMDAAAVYTLTDVDNFNMPS